ncbi:MAG: SHOCT domain-containing protein, partial [Clostridia bacterium]|nr:SHOCT domain-containing protein [Clostridia bacterium]
ITLNDMANPTVYINLITTETKKSSFLYKTCEKQAQEIVSLFQVMCEQNKTANTALTPLQETSSADEIKKYKELLDTGVITQEEFDSKKKQLLGL